MAEFQPNIEKVQLTPLTVGRFENGNSYGVGVVIEESQTDIKVCYSRGFNNCHCCPLNDICPVALGD